MPMKRNDRIRTVNKILEMGMRLIGIWPRAKCVVFHQVAWILTMMMAQIFQYKYIVVHFAQKDLFQLMESLSTTLSYGLIILKLIIVWLKRHVFRDILLIMEEDWNERVTTNWQALMMIESARLSDRWTKYIASFYWMVVLLYASGLTVSSREVTERQLLIKMEFPFDTSVSPIYETVLAVQLLQQLMAVTVESTLNGLMMTLIFHVGGQVNIIRRGLSEMSLANSETCMDAVKDLVDQHYSVINFTNNIESLYSYLALLQFTSNIVLLCLLGFVIVISLDSGQGPMTFVKFLPYYAAANVGVFVYCFSGEYLTTKSESIADAAYDSAWYNLKPSVSRGLLLLILRSQRRLTITVGKFMDLSYKCFATILKASASYVSVLHAMC